MLSNRQVYDARQELNRAAVSCSLKDSVNSVPAVAVSIATPPKSPSPLSLASQLHMADRGTPRSTGYPGYFILIFLLIDTPCLFHFLNG